MKKQSRQLLILLLVLVLVVGGFLGMRLYNRKQAFESLNEMDAETGTVVLDIAEEDVTQFSYDFEGKVYTFENKEDTWYYTEDVSQPLKQYMIWYQVEQFAPLRIQVQIDDVTDLSLYGLDEPTKVICFATASEEYTINIGDYNNATSTHYAILEGTNTVYTLSHAQVSAFERSLEDLLDVQE